MKIGHLTLENNVLLAPMAGISDLPYRRIMKSFGAALVFSEMISANGLIFDGKRTRQLLRSDACEKPLAVQLFGFDPDFLAQAAAMVEDEADVIDINMGCPVKKVIRSGAGCALMKDPLRVARIVQGVRRATQRPLTIKFRSGWDDASINYLQIGDIAQQEGADAVILHPRTRAQGFGGKADWRHLRALKMHLRIPVIGSGDIFQAQDAFNMQQMTACDAVMIGRGAYGNPWLLRDILQGYPSPPPTSEERAIVALNHLDHHLECFGERRTLGEMRKHLCWYSRGLPGAATFRAQINRTSCVEQMRQNVRAFFLDEMMTA